VRLIRMETRSTPLLSAQGDNMTEVITGYADQGYPPPACVISTGVKRSGEI